MRAHGHRSEPVGLDRHGHACLIFDRDEQVQDAVAGYLRDGVALNQRIACVGPDEPAMRAALAGLEELDPMIESGALVLLRLDEIYTDDGITVDFASRLRVYEAATEQAIADGFAGLRVAALVTDLVLDPARWQKHTRWESFADRYMATNPLSALCCYDARKLPAVVARDLASVHPVSCGAKIRPAFRIFAEPEGRAIDGELDYFDCDDLDRLLLLTENDPRDGRLDLSALTFIDARALLTIDRYRRAAERAGQHAHIERANPVVSRVAELLEVELGVAS